MSEGDTLLASDDGRYYVVPAGREILAGQFRLVSLAGEEWDVDPNAVALYEVTVDDAERFMRHELEQALANVADLLTTALLTARDPGSDLHEILRRLGVNDGDNATVEAALQHLIEAPGIDLPKVLDEIRQLKGRDVVVASIEASSDGLSAERSRQRRQERYLRDARSAIADSLRAVGITPLNDPDEAER